MHNLHACGGVFLFQLQLVHECNEAEENIPTWYGLRQERALCKISVQALSLPAKFQLSEKLAWPNMHWIVFSG